MYNHISHYVYWHIYLSHCIYYNYYGLNVYCLPKIHMSLNMMCSYKKRRGIQRSFSHFPYLCTEERPSEDSLRKWGVPSGSPGREASQKTTPLTPWSLTSSLQNCGKIYFCLSHSVDVILLWQPKLIQILVPWSRMLMEQIHKPEMALMGQG